MNVRGLREEIFSSKSFPSLYFLFFAQQEKNKWFVLFLNLGLKRPQPKFRPLKTANFHWTHFSAKQARHYANSMESFLIHSIRPKKNCENRQRIAMIVIRWIRKSNAKLFVRGRSTGFFFEKIRKSSTDWSESSNSDSVRILNRIESPQTDTFCLRKFQWKFQFDPLRHFETNLDIFSAKFGR